MSVNITPTKLFRLKEDTVVWPKYGSVRTMPAGTILWQHGNRPSSMGGYIGTFSETYRQCYGMSPKDKGDFHLKTDLVEPIYEF